jgi:hypothetical protein
MGRLEFRWFGRDGLGTQSGCTYRATRRLRHRSDQYEQAGRNDLLGGRTLRFYGAEDDGGGEAFVKGTANPQPPTVAECFR